MATDEQIRNLVRIERATKAVRLLNSAVDNETDDVYTEVARLAGCTRAQAKTAIITLTGHRIRDDHR